jgi:hypothetical protein
LCDRSNVLLSGASAADAVGLLGDAGGVEIYAARDERSAIVAEHALMPDGGDVTVRWVPQRVWDQLDISRRVAPRAAVLVDLLEGDDPRGRREAARALAS